MFFGIQGCSYFAINKQDEQGIAKAEAPIDKEDNEVEPLENFKEVLSLFPEFAKKWQGKQDLAKARALMFKGDYEASLKYNKEVLRQFPRMLGDQALFQMGLNYAHPENPKPDNQKSIECFQKIIEKFPKSSIGDEAVIWILFIQKTIENKKMFDNLQRDKENLKDQIEKLKNIDLGIEDKKRIDSSK
ncbi:MAG: tetratricopeptide repeat protein [Candidatus Scalindua sp.]|nr:tetratricopeptide repeat protein [Candidatus Scalindua sp.]